MGRGRAPPSVMNTSIHEFFDNEIAGVRSTIAGCCLADVHCCTGQLRTPSVHTSHDNGCN